jgi:hypothetical protein
VTRKAKAKADDAAKPQIREPTAAEAEAIRRALESQATRPARPSVQLLESDGPSSVTIANPHSDRKGWIAHAIEAFGTSSDPFLHQSYARVMTAVADRQKPLTEEQANAALALMAAIAPRDELEAVIGEQIIAAHTASLDFLSRARLNAGEYRDTAVAYANAATKLSRTMLAAVDTLSKLRSGGRQRIEVVYVNGPAVIGDNAQTVIAGGPEGAGSGNIGQPHTLAALSGVAAPSDAALRSQDPPIENVPSARHQGEAAVQDARRQEPGSAHGQGERPLHVRSLDAGAPRGAPAGAGARADGEGDAG